jgi:hypothetical protein
VRFQQAEDFVGQRRQLLGDRLQFEAACRSRNPVQDAAIEPVDLGPVRRPLPSQAHRNPFFDARGDHLGDVAPAQRDALAHQSQHPFLHPDFLGPGLEFIGARHQRPEIEAERRLDRAALPLAGEALAVRAVAADHEPAVDERRQVPAQRRRRHAMCAQRELLVRGEYDQAFAAERGFGMEGQQSVENGQSPF